MPGAAPTSADVAECFRIQGESYQMRRFTAPLGPHARECRAIFRKRPFTQQSDVTTVMVSGLLATRTSMTTVASALPEAGQ